MSWDEKRRDIKKVFENAVRRGGFRKIVKAATSTRAHLNTDHAMHHEAVPLTPQCHQLVDVYNGAQEATSLVKNRLILIQCYEER